MIEYAVRGQREHAAGGKEHGWSDKDHEQALLAEMGKGDWILCAIKMSAIKMGERGCTYYFYRTVSA